MAEGLDDAGIEAEEEELLGGVLQFTELKVLGQNLLQT